MLDVGGVKAGPGPEVTEAEELDRVVPAIDALAPRFDVPVSVDTWRASVARAAYGAGAVRRQRHQRVRRPRLPAVAAAKAGAAVVATHIRLAPRVRDPEPHYDDVVATVADFLTDRAERARAAGIPADRIVLDAGLDLGKTAEQSLDLLRASGPAGRPRLPAAPLGVQQDVPRRAASTSRSTERRDGLAGRRRPRHQRSAAGCCGCTTSPGPAGSATRSPPSWRRQLTPAETGSDPAPAYLVRGDDASLVGPGRPVARRSAGRGPGRRPRASRSTAGRPADDLDVGAVVDACTTPPFLVDRRVVVVRDAGPAERRRRSPPGRRCSATRCRPSRWSSSPAAGRSPRPSSRRSLRPAGWSTPRPGPAGTAAVGWPSSSRTRRSA